MESDKIGRRETPLLPAIGKRSGQKVGRTMLVAPNIMLLATSMRRSGAFAYRRALGLERNQWSLIAVLGENSDLSLFALAEHVGMDKGQLSREVSGLVMRGLLAKEKRSRLVHIRLTKLGQSVFRKLQRVQKARNRRFLKGLGFNQRAQLFQLLELLRQNAHGEMRRELAMN